ncbi:hypothetical protein V8E53_007432 [Lactarius tabidus]
MLRTGQSLLATALIHLHLGREWQRPPQPVCTADYATYVQILTWSSIRRLCCVRLAYTGCRWRERSLGRRRAMVGRSTGIKSLVQRFPDALLSISVAVDGQIFQTGVYILGITLAHATFLSPQAIEMGRSRSGCAHRYWAWYRGCQPDLLIYYETIKYTFPQSVGIVGGRPPPSYYFVGSQPDLFLDPHHTPATIPLRPPTQLPLSVSVGSRLGQPTPERGSVSPPGHHRSPMSPPFSRTGSSTFSYPTALPSFQNNCQQTVHLQKEAHKFVVTPPALMAPVASIGRGSNAGLDLSQVHYVTSYSAAELRTFHSERVRKMPLSGLDPSMLIGFLCKTEADWMDLRCRVAEVCNP